MYTLRVIEEKRDDKCSPFDSETHNFYLGAHYSVYRRGLSRAFERFLANNSKAKKVLDESSCADAPLNDVRGIVLAEEGGNVIHLLDDSENIKRNYYIVMESGRTFERI